MERKNNPPVGTDEQLAGHGKTARVGLLLAVAGAGLTVVCFLTMQLLVLLAGIALLVTGLILRGSAVAKMKAVAAQTLIPAALSQVLDEVNYQPKSRISDAVVRHTDMGFPFDFDEIRGGDYVCGVYRGLRVEMSDLELVDVRRVHTKNGTHTEHVTVFRGQWIICDFCRKLSADVILSERGALGQLLAVGGIKTENEAFNKRFFIRSQSEHDAFYLLTPHRMERVMQMDALAHGDSYLRFGRDGRVHIAVSNGKNLFEIRGEADAAALQQRFRQEMESVTELLDALQPEKG